MEGRYAAVPLLLSHCFSGFWVYALGLGGVWGIRRAVGEYGVCCVWNAAYGVGVVCMVCVVWCV
jgi:hypothetical protein